jgi:hypothetical protein
MLSSTAASIPRRISMTDAEKVRENRLRRMAERQGYQLVKSRRRDPQAIDYGRWMIIDVSTNGVVAGAGRVGPDLDLDDVELYLTDREAFFGREEAS